VPLAILQFLFSWSAEKPVIEARRVSVAIQPDQIPSLFAEAWNKRDPDAIASLFEDDAEFVNVTGLWWHRRASIRKAHAYGLDRIFSQSTLSVVEVRIKALSDGIAVSCCAGTCVTPP
jgi:uncharacterized protein (TIGR02246 family)